MTIKQDAEDFMMAVKLRFAELESRIAKLEAGEQEPPRPGHNIKGAHDSTAAQLAQNTYHQQIQNRANW